MRQFDYTLNWGRRKITGMCDGPARTADGVALALLRMARKNWRGPKLLRLSLTF